MSRYDPASVARAWRLQGANLTRLRALAAKARHHREAAVNEVIVDSGASAVQAHRVAADAEHNPLHALPRLAAALVHADPQAQAGDDHHAVLVPHR
ncbi:MAG TPA: hypothetical protein VFJ07_20300 [Streptosporangiaceae bacterium]|nr:hypothetical protein [Streptosporangiaceae bacterium]